MPRPVTISSGQWWDVPFETLCAKMAEYGYDGIELACWGDHFDVERALNDDAYVGGHRDVLEKHGLKCFAISNHNFFAEMWNPVLDIFPEEGVKFALEVHPTEIAFDIVTSQKAVDAIGGRKEFGFNYDPSHLGYQGVDYIGFIRMFGDRIYHAHMKDAYWSLTPTQAGVFGGHLEFGDPRRYWDFRSVGRGLIDFEAIIRAFNEVGYQGPLSVEFEDPDMDREHGTREACAFVRQLDFTPSKQVINS